MIYIESTQTATYVLVQLETISLQKNKTDMSESRIRNDILKTNRVYDLGKKGMKKQLLITKNTPYFS